MQRRAEWRWLAVTGALFGLAAVILAALGAHSIPLRDASAVRLWDIALQIHFFHVAVILGLSAIAMGLSFPGIIYNGLLLALGTALFSGSLYLRAASIDLLPAYLTPTGGALLVAAWLWLVIIFMRKNSE